MSVIAHLQEITTLWPANTNLNLYYSLLLPFENNSSNILTSPCDMRCQKPEIGQGMAGGQSLELDRKATQK